MKSQSEIHFLDLSRKLSEAGIIVLGEKHNTTEVQLAQADVIESVVYSSSKFEEFTVGWEFLNYTEKERTQKAFEAFYEDKIDAQAFLVQTQGHAKNKNYIPILEATKKFSGNFAGVNLSSKDKAPVVKGGIQAADPRHVPPGFDMGSENYFERFFEAMSGGHASSAQIKNYFAAQCLTDDVMAYHLIHDSQDDLKFLITGHFHSDYSDGVVARIRKRAPQTKIVTVRFVDAADYSEAELNQISRDPKYGELADFLYFVNEPGSFNNLIRYLKIVFPKNL